MSTIFWALGGLALILGLATFVVLWMHYPFRKWVRRKLDLTWNQRARVAEFSPARIAAEEADMFISSTVMRDACDIIWDEFDEEAPANLCNPHPEGTVIWVNTKLMPRFIQEFLPRMQSKFVLASARENNPVRLFDIDKVLANDNMLCWFVENYEFSPHYIDTGRVVPLPLGMNYHKLDPNSPNRAGDMGAAALPGAQQAQMKTIRDEIAPIRERPLKVYCNFQLNMDTFLRHPHAIPRAEARAEAIAVLKDSPLAIIEPRQTTRNDVWRRKKEAVFEASPRGNSIDCHRTWEALLLKSIPIVKTSLMDPIYKGLPVAIVQDWNEVTEERLAQWLEEFAPWFDQPLPPELFSNHWIARMHSWKPEDARPQLAGHGV
ncbi:hypothetical protein [Pseudooceanicola sp.]|uniref:hypothetical protein n=1 Tax=Pseudooceanicola sp. TaxID=1914328 RepID=UPI00260D1F54|nr:hypothetical protein [Pseudooceanicola sp.]MDF1856035.1 hypothetical protein [Pseudooceanicola sp.]